MTDPNGRKIGLLLERLGLRDRPEMRRVIEVPRKDGARLAQLFGNGRAQGTILLWISLFCLSMLVGFITQWAALIYTYAGKPTSVALQAVFAFQIGGIAGGLGLPIISRKVGVTLVLSATLLLGAVALVVLGVSLTAANAVIFVVAASVGFLIAGSLFIIYSPVVAYYPTEIRATGSGAATSFGRIGNIVAPIIAGALLAGGLSPAKILMVMAAPLLVGGAAMLLFRVRCEDHAA